MAKPISGSIRIHGVDVPVTSTSNDVTDNFDNPNSLPRQIKVSTVCASPLLRGWAESIQPGYTVKKVTVTDVRVVDFAVMSMTIKVEMTDPNDCLFPDTVFLCGHRVAVLIELTTPTQRWAVLVCQRHAPAGGSLYGIPTGELCADGILMRSVAFMTLENHFPQLQGMFTSNLTPLCAESMWLNPSVSEARVHFYHLPVEMDQSTFDRLMPGPKRQNQHGPTVSLVPWAQIAQIPDAGLLIALALYNARFPTTTRDIQHRLEQEIGLPEDF